MATYLNRDLLVRLDVQDDVGPIEGYTYQRFDIDEDSGDLVMYFTGPSGSLYKVPMEVLIENEDGSYHELLPGDERVWTVHHLEEEGERMVEVFPVR